MSGSSDGPPRSKYLRVRDQLIARLAGMEPGQPLPAERELAAELGVARMTLRKALAQLVADSLLFRRRGSGTFVARPRVAHRLTAVSSFMEFSADMRARGLCPGARTLSAAVRPAGMTVGACLRIQPTASILRIRRLRLADGIPMALEELHVPGDVVPGLTGEDLGDHSFYALLSQRYGLTLTGGTQTIEPMLTSAEDAALLEVAPGAPAFLFERTMTASTGRVVEFVRSVYRGDRYRIVVDLFPPGVSDLGTAPVRA
jgi:GntR family transcriptional regulator